MSLNRIKNILKNYLPHWLSDPLMIVFRKTKYWHFREKKVSFGIENKDKTFYVIRLKPPGAGLLSNYLWVLGHLIKIENKGYIPVVDMQNYRTLYSEKSEINGTKNAWEYYWQQPTEYTLEEVYKSKNVILSRGWLNDNEQISFDSIKRNEDIRKLYELSSTLRINDIVKKNYNDKVSHFLNKGQKVLGVVSRGSDYKSIREFGHSIQPEAEQLISIVERKMIEWQMDCIYLKTEDISVLEKFKSFFGDKVMHSDQHRFEDLPDGVSLHDISLGIENEKYHSNLDYLTEIIAISKCDAIIGGVNAGLKTAIILNGGLYEHVEIIDLGVYSDATRVLNIYQQEYPL